MGNKNYKSTILIDLDGVLNDYGLDGQKYNENNIPKIKQGTKEFLEKINSLDMYNLVLFTTRNSLLASKWLIENGIDKYFSNVTSVKIPAILHIDDRALCFKGDFNKTFEDIIQFRTYWK